MDIKFLFGWAKENGIELPTNGDGNINIPAAFALYDEWKKKGGINKGNKNESGLIEYTDQEKDNFATSKKIIVATDKGQILDFIQKARSNSPEVAGKKLLLGKIDNTTSERIKKEIGVDLNGYNIELRASDIGHAFNQHGNVNREDPRGQRAITENDISKFAEIVTSFDSVDVGKEKNSLTFIKSINGKMFAVTYYASGNKSLSLKTLYIRKK